MKALVVFETYFGNTEKIALAIGNALGSGEEAATLKATDVKPDQLAGIDLLVVGSPTRAFHQTKGVTNFLKSIPAGKLSGIEVAAFDTRVSLEEVNSKLLTGLAKAFGYAAEPIAAKLKRKGGELAAEPEGFIVKGTEGPLKEGELERAADWARKLLK
jgi:flavodoxin I